MVEYLLEDNEMVRICQDLHDVLDQQNLQDLQDFLQEDALGELLMPHKHVCDKFLFEQSCWPKNRKPRGRA